MRKLVNFILTVLAVIVGILGVGATFTLSAPGGAVFLVAAALLWPSVRAKVEEKTGRAWLSPLFGVLLALIAGPVVSAITAPSAEEIAAKEAHKQALVEQRKAAEAEKAAEEERRRAEAAAAKAQAEAEARKRDPRFQWQYGESVDEMTGKSQQYAYLESRNSLSLDFPYSGSNYGRVQVRRHPRHGLDVIVRVGKGQILCRSYNDCTIQIRFDENNPSSFSAAESSDNDPTVIFLRNPSRFIASARQAKTIRIQLPMHKAGNQVLRFETMEPLNWK